MAETVLYKDDTELAVAGITETDLWTTTITAGTIVAGDTLRILMFGKWNGGGTASTERLDLYLGGAIRTSFRDSQTAAAGDRSQLVECEIVFRAANAEEIMGQWSDGGAGGFFAAPPGDESTAAGGFIDMGSNGNNIAVDMDAGSQVLKMSVTNGGADDTFTYYGVRIEQVTADVVGGGGGGHPHHVATSASLGLSL